MVAHELQADGQAFRVEAARNRQSRQPGERRRDGEDVVEIHLHRVRASSRFFSYGEGGGRRGRSEDYVAALKGGGEITRDQTPDLLRLNVIGVVIAVRQDVGSDQDP